LEKYINHLDDGNPNPTQEEFDNNIIKLEKFQTSLNDTRMQRQQECQQLIANHHISDKTLNRIANPKTRSIFNRFFWFVTILLFTIMFTLFYIDTISQYLFANKDFYIELNQLTLERDQKTQLAFWGTSIYGSFVAIMFAISTLAIKDSILYFRKKN